MKTYYVYRWKMYGNGLRHLGRYEVMDDESVRWVKGKGDPRYQEFAEMADRAMREEKAVSGLFGA